MCDRKPLAQWEWDAANGSEPEAWRLRYVREQLELGRDSRDQISADDMDNDYEVE